MKRYDFCSIYSRIYKVYAYVQVPETNAIEEESVLNPISPENALQIKKKGRQSGAVGYQYGDLVALLDSVDTIVPLTEKQWEKVTQHYNEGYCETMHRPFRSLSAMKTKFRELCHGVPTGGGGRDELEKRAKKIQWKMDKNAGVYRDEDSKSEISEDSVIVEDEDIEGKKRKVSSPSSRRTRFAFEQTITTYLQDQKEEGRRRHDEKMEIFKLMIDAMKSVSQEYHNME